MKSQDLGPRKEVRTMNTTFRINWKFVAAFGLVSTTSILAFKVDAAGAEKVLIHAIDACKEFAVALQGNC